MATLTRRSLYAPDVYQNCLSRIEKLAPEKKPEWGRMTAAQMLSHCAEVQEVTNGKALDSTPWVAKLFRGMIRKMVLSDKPYPRSTRTHPQYERSSAADFETEKRRLLDALARFLEEKEAPRKHPLFGGMSPEEKGWAMYKHLDHHLSQFGV